MSATEIGVWASPAAVRASGDAGPAGQRADGLGATALPVRLTCASCQAAGSPSANFCHLCGKPFAIAPKRVEVPIDLRAERRRVTILFCDLVDSVSLCAGQDPEDVAEAMRRFHAALGATMLRLGGHFERPMGDGALFYFGYPAASEDDCERAVAAALAGVECIERLPPQLGQPLRVRMGVSTGVVVVSDLRGAVEGGGHDIVGDVANLAARLQQTAAPGSVLVSDAVRRLTRAAFEYEDMGCRRLRGWAEEIRLWRPVRRIRRPDRFGARFADGASPLVGRAAELAQLSEAWERTRAGAGGVVLLTGEPGFGKSRLLHELVASLEQAGAEVVLYLCAPTEQEAALHPVIEQLRHEAGLAADDDAPARRERIAAALADCPAPEAALIASLMAPEIAGAAAPARPQASPERQRDLILRALLGRLLRAAAACPLCLVVEDAHWSDPTTRALLARIAAAAALHPLLMAVAARPQFRPEWAEHSEIRRIQLDPLPPEESERLVRAAAGLTRLDDEVVEDIVARSDGVPLFLEEVTRAVIEPSGADQDVPASIHASLLSRIDGLGRARAVAEVAAAIGRVFELPLLTAVCRAQAAELPQHLARLASSGLVRAEEVSGRTVFMFRHALIRDAAYGTIVRGKRRELHGRIAETLEREFPAEAALHPQQLAQHYAAASRDQQAALWWLRAGLQALQRSAMTEAMAQLRRALALLERPATDDESRLRLMLEVLVVYGKALLVTQGHVAEPTLEAVSRARALCARLPDAPEAVTVLFLAWTQSFFGGRLTEAEARAHELLDEGERRDDDAAVFLGGYVLGLTRLLRGDLRDSFRLLRQTAARFDPARRHLYARPSIGDPHVILRTYLGWGAVMGGAFGQAAAEHETAISDARALHQPFSTCLALCTRFYLVLQLHGPETAAASLAEYDEASAQVAHFGALGEIMRGWLLAARGEFEAGLELMRRGKDRQAAGGTWLHHSKYLTIEAETLVKMGRAGDALEVLAAAERLRTEAGEHWHDAETRRVRALALAASGEPAAAEAELVEAERIACDRGQNLFALRAATARARLILRRNQVDEAAALVRERLSRVEHDMSVLDVADAERLLAGLAAGR
jgi:class 3 adenylate cyclase